MKAKTKAQTAEKPPPAKPRDKSPVSTERNIAAAVNKRLDKKKNHIRYLFIPDATFRIDSREDIFSSEKGASFRNFFIPWKYHNITKGIAINVQMYPTVTPMIDVCSGQAILDTKLS